MLKQNQFLLRLFITWAVILIASMSFLSSSYGFYDLDTIIFGSIITLIPLYFLPAIVAIKKSHPSTLAITVLNLFMGWFFFGWVASLIWALSNSNKTIIFYTEKEWKVLAYDFSEAAEKNLIAKNIPFRLIDMNIIDPVSNDLAYKN